jgi:dihydrofolate reductase
LPTIKAIGPCDEYPNALLWHPAGAYLEETAAMLAISQGKSAILGGPEIYRLLLPRYDVFHLSRAAGLKVTSGRPLFQNAAAPSPEAVERTG